jgi:hypothetical protein
MDFKNSSLWELKYIQSFSGQQIGLQTLRIPQFSTGSFDSEIIKVRATSSTALPNRKRCGLLSHCVTLNNGEVNVIDVYRLYLNDSKIFNLKAFAPFFLRFAPDRDIRQLTITMYQFIG